MRSKYQQTTGHDLPCEVNCPCADPAFGPFFPGVLSGEIPVEACFTSFEDVPGILIYNPDVLPEVFPFPAFSVEVEGQWLCGLVGGSFTLPISPAQGQYCAQLLEQKANSEGVTCEPPPD